MFHRRNTTVDAKTIGQLIQTTRKNAGITQQQLAMVSGTGLRFIIEIEKGKPTCQLEKVLSVIRALGIKIKLEPPIIKEQSK